MIDFDNHERATRPVSATRARFLRAAAWNLSVSKAQQIADAFNRLDAVLSPYESAGWPVGLTMFQSSPSTQKTEYALVLHAGPSADQRRYFRPGVILHHASWETRRGRRLPVREVVTEIDAMVDMATRVLSAVTVTEVRYDDVYG